MIKVKKNILIQEINISLELTKNVNTHHIVKYVHSNKCYNANDLFSRCPNYITYLNNDNNNKLCNILYRNHPKNKIADEFISYEMEYCNYSLMDYLEDLCYLDILQITLCLDILLFQLIYTLKKINEKYPNFCHNDLFIRNILGVREHNTNNYYQYELMGKKFFIPIKFFNPKINDFGQTTLNEEYKYFELFDNAISKDIYNIIYDIYNGACLGSKSLTKLFNDNNMQYKIPKLKKYFDNFFNTDRIDEMIKKNHDIHWNWDNILDPNFSKYIEWSNNIDNLIENYFNPRFNEINKVIMIN